MDKIRKVIEENSDKLEQELVETIKYLLRNEGIEDSPANLLMALRIFYKEI